MSRCASILVVEDDQDIRCSVRDVLELEGYFVQTAENGQIGLELLHKMEPPCLVLLDLMMPVVDGLEFLQKKRADIKIAPIPVVIVSAIAERSKAEPDTPYIKKPIDIHVLLDVVRQYCGIPTS